MHQLHSTIVLVEFALLEFLSNVRIKQQEKHLSFCTILSTLKSKSIYSNYKNFDEKYDLALVTRETAEHFFSISTWRKQQALSALNGRIAADFGHVRSEPKSLRHSSVTRANVRSVRIHFKEERKPVFVHERRLWRELFHRLLLLSFSGVQVARFATDVEHDGSWKSKKKMIIKFWLCFATFASSSQITLRGYSANETYYFI